MQMQKKHNHHTQSQWLVLHEDLIQKILLCAKVKTLIRFKNVSKLWNSFISNPSFIKLQLQKSLANDSLDHLQIVPKLYFKYFHKFSKVSRSIRFLLEHPSPPISRAPSVSKPWLVVGSCNGLQCVAYLRESEGFKICFWNMAIRLRSENSPYLSINPREFIHNSFGFGYDPLSDTYKVVAVTLSCIEMKINSETKVYSKGDNCWRKVEGFPVVESVWNDGVYLSGTLNWGVTLIVKDVVDADLPPIIVSLDLGQETCTKLMLPKDFVDVTPSLRILGDSLCAWHDCNKTNHLIIWQMKEFGNEKSWTKLLNVSYLSLQIYPIPIHRKLIPLCMLKNGDVLILSSSVDGDKRAILYSTKDDTLKHFQIFSPTPTSLIDLHLMVFTESLIMPY